MATSLLTLLDDIASVLDDVAAMTKVATRKTAGVLGDDLALNANQVTGVRAEREIPVVWAVAKGSFFNKTILVPVALLISAIAPWAITPLLMIGGLFLCYEGAEKLAHRYLHPDEQQRHKAAVADESVDLVAVEKEKIRGAIRTDFILSAEIIVISLGTVADASFGVRLGVLVAISLIMTVGVYGLVAAIVKMDDAGLYLESRGGVRATFGRGLLAFAPRFMKVLSIVGTAAMFLVGGGIIAHGFHWIAVQVEATAEYAAHLPGVGQILAGLAPTLLQGLVGLVAGAIVLAIVEGWSRLRGGGDHDSASASQSPGH